MKHTWILAAFFLVFSVFNAAASDIELSIRFYDKKVYHISGPSGEPVYVQVTVTNRSPQPYHFKLADERVFSVDFDIRNLANQSLEPADYILRRRSESRNVYFRDVAIEPGESFSFVEDIRNYALLKDAGSFVVQARIFPDLFREASLASVDPLVSNRLNLNLRPASIPGPDGIPFQFDTETGATLAREKLSPDKVIDYMLTARQKSQWEKFFLYIDFDAMITRDPTLRRSWLNESEEGRLRMIHKYKDDLKNNVIDKDFAFEPPSNFRIEKTSYTGETGTVEVTEWFMFDRLRERRRYIYFFRKHDDIWTIEDYTVTRLGTE